METEIEGAESWNKLERVSQKTGYRDGVSDGRESKFQESFDRGFAEGFKNGFAIGKLNGALLAHAKFSNSDEIKDPLLEKMGRGWCQICPTKDISSINLEESIRKQTNVSNNYLKQLNVKYRDKSSTKLPENI